LSIQSLTGGIVFDAGLEAGAMTVTAHGDVTETENADLEGGDLTVTSTTGGINLMGGYHDFSGTVSLNAAGDAQFYNDAATVLGASVVGGQLYVASTGDVTQNGALSAASLAVEAACFEDCNNPSVTLTDTGNTIAGDVAFDVAGDVAFTDSVGFSLGRVVFADQTSHTFVGGDLTATALTGGITINGGVETGYSFGPGPGCDCTDPTLQAAGDITETSDGYLTGGDLNANSTGGSITLLNSGNALTGVVSLTALQGSVSFAQHQSVTLGAGQSGGDFLVLSTNDIDVQGSVQNSGTGAVTLVAGWNGTTLDPSHLGDAGVFGNNSGTIAVGGENAFGDVAVGSAAGTTSLYANALTVSGLHGYAQVGYYGAGLGAIIVHTTGAVTLSGSASESCDSCYAQIGNGGVFVDGDTGGNIAVYAGGNVALTAGSNDYSYAQIGNGGDSSSGAAAGNVVVQSGGSVALTGAGDYTEIGNGGWGTDGNHSGSVTVTAAADITLTGAAESGYGYVQIGNGHQGSFINNSGSDSGDVTVTAQGGLTLTGGGTADYAQIGNGAADGGPATSRSMSAARRPSPAPMAAWPGSATSRAMAAPNPATSSWRRPRSRALHRSARPSPPT
jgi:hypothetical protein